MPKQQYPTTRVNIDATETYIIQQPHFPELQQMTFSNFMLAKAFVGITHDGAISFVSLLLPGNASDKH